MVNLRLVKNERKYWDFIRNLRNENVGFNEQVNITQSQQEEYMKKYGDCYYVCLKEGNPCGFVGCINGDIRVAVCKEYRKCGIGKFMIEEIIRTHPTANAKILMDNTASMSLFESCGFKKKYIIYVKE